MYKHISVYLYMQENFTFNISAYFSFNTYDLLIAAVVKATLYFQEQIYQSEHFIDTGK